MPVSRGAGGTGFPDPFLGPVEGRALPAAPVYGARPGDAPLVDLVFLGRVSDEDLQDPTLSIPRQLASCRAVLPPGARIVAHYWDVESGRIDPALRGRRSAHERFAVPVPRDGGIRDLLEAAARPDRCFDAVICEAIDRVARRTYGSVKIEHDLENAGVPLLAADEGITHLRKRATAILTRRVKQATAEWYVLETLEKAWDGFCEHTVQGWNIGVPPYGYLAERVPHPVPAKRAEGLHKTRLLLDPVRAPVVAQVFAWRVGVPHKSCQDIADRLNADPDRYPPPVAIGGTRSRGSWSARSVYAILANPKYTGYMVWNRRARNTGRGRFNPPALWVWSPLPTHPQVVDLDTYRAAAAIGYGRRGSRAAPTANPHPATERTYLLRSYVRCALCHRRMEATTRKKRYVYLRCRIRPTSGHDAAHRWPGHPPDLYVPQHLLLDGVLDFFAGRVFGPDRHHLLARGADEASERDRTDWQEKILAVQRVLDDLADRRARLVTTLETARSLDDALLDDINRRVADISREQAAKRETLAHLRAHPPAPTGRDAELLDLLGTISRAELARVPDPLLRELFDACDLEINYDGRERLATCTVTIDERNLETIATTPATAAPTPNPAGPPTGGLGMHTARSEGFEPPTF